MKMWKKAHLAVVVGNTLSLVLMIFLINSSIWDNPQSIKWIVGVLYVVVALTVLSLLLHVPSVGRRFKKAYSYIYNCSWRYVHIYSVVAFFVIFSVVCTYSGGLPHKVEDGAYILGYHGKLTQTSAVIYYFLMVSFWSLIVLMSSLIIHVPYFMAQAELKKKNTRLKKEKAGEDAKD